MSRIEIEMTASPVAGDAGGIDILVRMARQGEIDPANIDIIDLTDRFLQAIAEEPKESLRQSGRILFHASVLLRMKAEALLHTVLDDEELNGDDFLEFDEYGSPIIYDSHNLPIARQITLSDLERALVRRTQRKAHCRRVTLEDLITALREAERIERERKDRRPVPRIVLDGQPEIGGFEDMLDLAHEEDLEVLVGWVELIISEHLDSRELMPLTDLLRLMGCKSDWVDAFLAVLFIASAGKIELEQEEFYGPVYLRWPVRTRESQERKAS